MKEKIEKLYTRWRLTDDLFILANLYVEIEKLLLEEEFPLKKYEEQKYKI